MKGGGEREGEPASENAPTDGFSRVPTQSLACQPDYRRARPIATLGTGSNGLPSEPTIGDGGYWLAIRDGGYWRAKFPRPQWLAGRGFDTFEGYTQYPKRIEANFKT